MRYNIHEHIMANHPVRLSLKPNSCDLYALLLTLTLFCYGVLRSSHEHRWSYWAYGDAQVLNAAVHFQKEGFLKNHFLIQVAPGYINNIIPNNLPNGRYSHYPALHGVIAGLFAKFFGDPRYPSRYSAVLFGSFAILLWYLFSRQFYGGLVGLISSFFIAFSVINLDFMDALANQSYDSFFRAAGLFLCTRSVELTGRSKTESSLSGIRYPFFWDAALWAVMFLEMCNSVEYAVYLMVFYTGYAFMRGKFRESLGKILIFALAPLLAFSLHFLTVVVEWGGVKEALRDLGGISADRATGLIRRFDWSARDLEANLIFPNWRSSLMGFFSLLGARYCDDYKTALISVIIYWPIKWSVEGRSGMIRELTNDIRLKILLLLGLCGMSFWIILPDQSRRMISYIPMHGFPVLALLFAWTASALTIDLKSLLSRELSLPAWKRQGMLMGVSAGLALLLLSFKPTIRYLIKYPNLLWNQDHWAIHPISKESWLSRIEEARLIRKNTKWGDIILVPKDSGGNNYLEGNSIEEFYAQRKYVRMGDNPDMCGQILTILRDNYKARFLEKEPLLAETHFYIWVDKKRVPADLASFIDDHLPKRIITQDWIIYRAL